jgi:hypothetical protein
VKIVGGIWQQRSRLSTLAASGSLSCHAVCVTAQVPRDAAGTAYAQGLSGVPPLRLVGLRVDVTVSMPCV